MTHSRSPRNVSRVPQATRLLLVFLFLMLLPSAKARAAIPVRQAGPEKRDRYLDSGVFVGGHDQGPMNLLNIRHSLQSVQKMERLVFDVGGDGGQAHRSDEGAMSTGRPGFFHISIQKAPRRIVVDLEN